MNSPEPRQGGIGSYLGIISKLIENPQGLNTILNLASRFLSRGDDASGNNGGDGVGFKIPDGLFDDLPDADGEQDPSPLAQNAEERKIDTPPPPKKESHETIKVLKDEGHPHSAHDSVARRCALLLALKPYVNDHRRETIDMMISINKLSEVFSGFAEK